METKYLVLTVSALTEYGGRINGAVLKVDDAFRERMADLRRRREKAEADLELIDDTPTFVDNYSQDADEIEDALMNHLDLYELFFEPGEYIKVTREKAFVPKGWKTSWRPL